MRRRAFGQETEYGRVLRIGENANVTSQLSAPLGLGSSYGKQFLRNGARFYQDVGVHVEYATPECDAPEQLIAHVLAGNAILAARVQTYCRSDSLGQTVLRMYSNNICNYSQEELPFGTHENYQIENVPIRALMEPLMAYVVTRQLVLGAGRYRILPRGGVAFELAQRSGFLECDYNTNTMSQRPIINLRDEPHARDSKRLHLISGDNAILPQNIGLKFAMMSVLLTMAEEHRLKGITLANPVNTLHGVSHQPGARHKLLDGTRMTALEIQQFYYEQARSFVESEPELAGMAWWVSEYGRHLARLAESLDPAAHVGELCWATKKVILDHLRQKGRTPAQLQGDEMSMSEVACPNSYRQVILQRYGRYDALAVKRAMTEPPETTRAHARGELLESGDVSCDWEVVTNQAASVKYLLPDPLDPVIPEPIEFKQPAASTPMGPCGAASQAQAG